MRSGWRWGNVPLPETFLAGLGAGLLLQVVAPWRPPWAAAEVDLERPDRLVRRGPYAHSRNPMYVASAAVYVGIALVAGAAWPLALLPAVLLATHVVIVREERVLDGRFGAAYRSYRASVRRYL
jgi:protein-S-isoprenylcysteine O-methyltransferase Ste14